MKWIANPVEVDAQRIRTVVVHEPTWDRKKFITASSVELTLEDGTTFWPTAEMLARITIHAGDYVVTQADGYVYLNPRAVFERKYHPAQ